MSDEEEAEDIEPCPDCGRKTRRVELGGQVIYEHADTASLFCSFRRPK